MKTVEVNLSDKELEILESLEDIKGRDGEKLRTLYRYYLSHIPELRSAYYKLKRYEDKDEIDDVLKNIFDIYKNTEDPINTWESDRLDKLIVILANVNVMESNEGIYIIPTKFRDPFKMLLHDVATENKDLDEHVASLIAVIQLLKEFGEDKLEKNTIRDAAILLNEGWLYMYANKMREAREYLKAKKLKLTED